MKQKSTNLLTKRVIVGIDQTTVQHKGSLTKAGAGLYCTRSSSCISVQRNISHVVMMASPKNLSYLLSDFSLSEGIIGSSNEIRY